MASFNTLPFDILTIVMHYMQYHYTLKGDVRLGRWKFPLRTLSICRTWRAAALPVVYANLAIFLSDNDIKWREYRDNSLVPIDYPGSCSNAGLIHANGFGHLVKHLYLRDTSNSTTPFSWMYIADMLSVGNDECPGIDAVRTWVYASTKNKRKAAKKNPQVIGAFSEFAAAFAIRFPNVCDLHVEAIGSYAKYADIVDGLLGIYDHQLRRVKLLPGPFLSSVLTFNSREYFIVCITDKNYPNLPAIDPALVTGLDMAFSSQTHYWDLFRRGQNIDSIIFNNLTELVLRSDILGAHLLNTDNFQLSLPYLTKLTINSILMNEECAHILTGPFLKTLNYFGDVASALELCRQDISGLQSLEVQPDLYFLHRDMLDEFIDQTNELFTITHMVPDVYCKLFDFGPHYFSQINWPSLTRLKIVAGFDICEFLGPFFQLPNLSSLDVAVTFDEHFDDYDQFLMDILNREIEYLQNLCDLGPVQTKLKTIILHWRLTISTMESGDNDELEYEEHAKITAITEANPSLKRRFPQLEHIDLQWIMEPDDLY